MKAQVLAGPKDRANGMIFPRAIWSGQGIRTLDPDLGKDVL
jgi:hypothetical protein